MRKTVNGFTIVELLIVIVVIAILATISVVAYNGVQARANDGRIKAAAQQVDKAIQLYVADYGSFPTGLGWYATNPTGNNCPSSGGGWAAKPAYAHNCTLEYVLNENKLLPDSFMVSLPKNKQINSTSGLNTLMFYRCTPVGVNYFVLMWYLEAPSTQESSNFDSVMSQCGLGTSYRTTYGMQAAKLLSA